MERELIEFIKRNSLSVFNSHKTQLKGNYEDIFKTRDGKAVYTKIIRKISDNFCFAESSNLLNFFYFSSEDNLINNRQDFFKNIPRKLENNFLIKIKKPKPIWGPRYGIVAVTDNEETFSKLKKLDIPAKFLLNEDDVLELQNYDIVQSVDVEQFGRVLEQLPQSVFLDSIEEVYLERYLEALSGWSENFKVLEDSGIESREIIQILSELRPLLKLIENEKKEKITRENIEESLEKINEEISQKFKEFNISGDRLFAMLSENKMPPEIEEIIDKSIKLCTIPPHLFDAKIPVKIDEEEFDNFVKMQDANENTGFAEKIKKNSSSLKKVPLLVEKLDTLLLFYDFISGISKFIKENNNFPDISEELFMEDSKNIFLDNPQPINFNLQKNERCSILTGANSGGKTTLIEHIIQALVLSNIGLPLNGRAKIPLFSEIYYFAKNKGSASKGAFETLLTQMSKIRPGNKTLILADEIESVTEPGVAGKIISATSKYFIEKNCYLVIATHLGHEIKKVLPEKARIDGIEAKGLSSENELIVDHNPVLGRLANSTPELIVEKMAKSGEHEYYIYLHEYLKEN